MGLPRLFSCCFGGDHEPHREEYGLLGPAPLPADLQPQPGRWRSGWLGSGGQRAPAFGEGALRQDEFAPRFLNNARKIPVQYQDNPFAPAALSDPVSSSQYNAASSAAAGGWETEPTYVKERAAALAAEQAHAEAYRPKKSSRSTSPDITAAAPGDSSSYPVVDIYWHSQHSSSSAPTAGRPIKQARAGGRGRQRQQSSKKEQLLPPAPAFGQGALTKWH